MSSKETSADTACLMYDALHDPFTSLNTKNIRKEKQPCHLLKAVKSTHFQRQNDTHWYSSFITRRPLDAIIVASTQIRAGPSCIFISLKLRHKIVPVHATKAYSEVEGWFH